MNIVICQDAKELGRRAAEDAATRIRDAIKERGQARIVVATGASQFEVLASLVSAPAIDWAKVVGFHLDEYLGLPMSHPASFRGYLKKRLVDRVPIGAFHYINGEGDGEAECGRVGALIVAEPIDVALVGIGENGHLAFNDPPADFHTDRPYLVVDLDEACRRQQLGEGWFPTLDDVPRRAISMSIRQIMKSRAIVCSVPDERKAEAVRATVEGGVSSLTPASILQQHPDATLYLDPPAASMLTCRTLAGRRIATKGTNETK
ncbi:MAG: glucosamine-6-phosphate deaminase [Planctomycetaceae bacterium]|nr:glucosamine-6-phosphate deaminase [Planctomycetaceae bacterium]